MWPGKFSRVRFVYLDLVSIEAVYETDNLGNESHTALTKGLLVERESPSIARSIAISNATALVAIAMEDMPNLIVDVFVIFVGKHGSEKRPIFGIF